MIDILLVGAGAVGQVYARHLQLAGARVSFFVRPKGAETLAKGLVLYPLKDVKRGQELVPVELRPDAVLTSLDDVRARRWQSVWLCVPSDALLDEAWLRSIEEATPGAAVVALPPGVDSEERIRRVFRGRHIVPALIGMISYQAPLPGESVPRPGIAYVFPRLRPSAFGGEHGAEIAELLEKGGCPATEDQDVGTSSALGTCLLITNIAALELAGWSLAALADGPWLGVAARAGREAMTITAARLGVRRPLVAAFLRPWILRLVWALAPRMIPIDLEAYLRFHFSKVGAQTRQLLASFLRDGEARSLPAPAVAELLAKLDA